MVTVTEDPRLSVTVRLHAPEHGSRLKCVLTSSQRPSVLAAVRAGMSTWPVEAMDTEYSALVLTLNPQRGQARERHQDAPPGPSAWMCARLCMLHDSSLIPEIVRRVQPWSGRKAQAGCASLIT